MVARVRLISAGDQSALITMRCALWPNEPLHEHEAEVLRTLAGNPRSIMPLAVFVAEDAGGVVGFVEVSLRSHVDGCDPTRPAGYVEGWYVSPEYRQRGIGRALVAAAEHWCRAQGAIEMGSDTWIDNPTSQQAHEAVGFEVVDRCVNYRKSLR